MGRGEWGPVLEVQASAGAGDDAATGPVPRPGGSTGRRLDPGLVAVLALAVVLRFWRLGHQSLWYDEWLTTEATSGGVGDVIRHVATREGITPPYFAVMWVWAR
ncbi:MAG: hypothetical protein PV358_17670, partial [Acidimicrobiales bacterium]|nr:hypothetical protein [Acidimicrobiales bacterium]